MKVISLTAEHADVLDYFRRLDFPEGWNKQMILSALETGRFFGWIALISGKTAGFVTVEIGIDCADVQTVYTVAEMRRKGVGKLLMRTALNFIESKGVNKVLLEVNAENRPAIELYSGLGFKPLTIRKKYYINGADALVMVRENQYK